MKLRIAFSVVHSSGQAVLVFSEFLSNASAKKMKEAGRQVEKRHPLPIES